MTGLFQEFPPVTTAEWEALLTKDLKGRDPKTLLWHTEDGITVKPFYSAEDVKELALGESTLNGRSWHIGCRVVTEAGLALALDHGAQAIEVPPEMLRKVPLDRIAVYTNAEPSELFAIASGCFTAEPS